MLIRNKNYLKITSKFSNIFSHSNNVFREKHTKISLRQARMPEISCKNSVISTQTAPCYQDNLFNYPICFSLPLLYKIFRIDRLQSNYKIERKLSHQKNCQKNQINSNLIFQKTRYSHIAEIPYRSNHPHILCIKSK